MKPYMKNDEIKLFQKYLLTSQRFLEFGSGGSTLYAIEQGVPQIMSLETDKSWLDKLQKDPQIQEKIKKSELELVFQDLFVDWWKYVSWAPESLPIPEELVEKWKNYSNLLLKKKFNPDLVLIDGRFRVASLLKLYHTLSEKCIILFHDYSIRPQYHIVEDFFTPLELVNTLQVFRKKSIEEVDLSKLPDLILSYELVID